MLRVHNKTELKALIKEAIQNGTIYNLDNRTVVSHKSPGDHIADILIEKSGRIVLRSYPFMG
jgi:hypothetical protein